MFDTQPSGSPPTPEITGRLVSTGAPNASGNYLDGTEYRDRDLESDQRA